MSAWYTTARTILSRWGTSARFAVRHVVAAAFPGGSVAGELLDRVLECAQGTATDQEDAEARASTLASEEELRRVGEVLDEVNGRLSNLAEQVAHMDGLPDAADRLIRLALSTDEAVRAGFANLAGLVGRFDRVERQGREILDRIGYGNDLQATILELLNRQSVVVDFVEELRAAGVQPRQLGDVLAAFSDCLAQARAGKAAEALTGLRAIEGERPDSPAVQVALAASASVANDLRGADRALTRAAELRPSDARLGTLSRRVTQASSALETPARAAGESAGPKLGDVLDGWRLTQILGQGGWGQVFRAERDGQLRALKVLHPELSQRAGFAAAFRREILVLHGLGDQPHLVRFEDFNIDPAHGCWFFLMELVEGESLQTRLQRTGALAVGEALRLFGQLAGEGGLAAAHARGIVHRDIKPANILLRAGDGSPVLVDFGLALTGSRGPAPGQASGHTPTFAAPEQLRGKPADARSDVYSLAGTLFHALTLQEPEEFDASRLPMGVEPLRELFARSLDRRPENRPQDGAAFLRLLRGEPNPNAGPAPHPVAPPVVNTTPAPQVAASDLPRPPEDVSALEGRLNGLREHPEAGELIDLVTSAGADLSFDGLKSATRHPNWHVRRASAVLLGKLGPEGKVAVTVLVEALADPEAEIRQAAQDSLSLIDPEWPSSERGLRAVTFLRSQLADTQNDVRQGAARVLGLLSKGARAAIPDLVHRLVDHHEPVRQAARLALDQITTNWPSSLQAQQAVPGLVESLRATDEVVRAAAVSTLGIIRPGADEHLRALAALLWEGPTESRLAGMAVLAKIGTPSRPISPHVAANLVDPEAGIRKAAEDTLKAVDPNWPRHPKLGEVLPRLAELLNHADATVRAPAASFIGDYLPAPDAAPPLAAAELDPDPGVRKAAGEAFAKLPRKSVKSRYTAQSVGLLTKALSRADSGLRLQALSKLEWFGGEAVDSIRSIIPLLADPDESVRRAAERCLDSIDRDWNLNPGMQQAVPDLIEILKALPDNTAPQQARRDCIVKVLGGLGTRGGFLVERLIPLLKFVVPEPEVTVGCTNSWRSGDGGYTYAYAISRAAAKILGAFGATAAAAIPPLIDTVKSSGRYSSETALQAAAALDRIDPQWPENHLDQYDVHHFASSILEKEVGDLYWKICTRLTSKARFAVAVYAESGIDSFAADDVVRKARFLADLGAPAACMIPAIEVHYERARSHEEFYRGGDSWQRGQAEECKARAGELGAAIRRIRDASK